MKPKSTLSRGRHTLVIFIAWVSLLFLGWTLASDGATYSFGNATRINIPATGQTSGTASPYPSTITPSGVPGFVTSVSVTLSNFTHLLPDDVDIMLVGPGPNGPTNIMLMSDAGGTIFVGNLDIIFSNIVTVTASPYPPDSGQLSSRAYRPSNYAPADSFPGVNWTAPFNTNFSVFNGANPNGPWSLYVVDDSSTGSSTGNIAGGWRLTLDTFTEPVRITTQPADDTASPGGNAEFRVKVAGTPPFGFQWYRNGQVLVPFGQGSDTLTLIDVTPGDAGYYHVIVANSDGSDTSQRARLFVNGPIVPAPLPDRVVRPGEDVIFEAIASGTPPLRYQWTLNGAFLPNETNATLTLPKVQAQDGGAYAVVIWNDEDAVTVKPGTLRVLGSTTNLEVQDDYRDAIKEPVIGLLQGVIQGVSSNATTQPGEPVLRGGGKSVWFLYQAPETGIVTLNTRGSTFDTLMQVFDGPSWDRPITRDNDRAGFYTSTLQFNAQRGTQYLIQVDGFGLNGNGGLVNVSWYLQRPTNETERVSIIVETPVAQAVKEGGRATFSVVTESADDLFQWYSDAGAFPEGIIRGATQRSFTIPEAKREHVGFYWVKIRNPSRQTPVITEPVDLQIGTVPDIFSYDKFEDMFLPRDTGRNFGFGAGLMFAPAAGGGLDSGYISIGLGDLIGKAAASTQANNQPADPNPCGSVFSGTLYQRVLATNTGIIQVDTVGSAIPVRLAVYSLAGVGTPPLVCDLSSASNGLPAMVQFDAVEGVNYSVVLAGYQATGTVQINLQMGAAPPLSHPLQYLLVASNGTAQLNMPATNWYPEPTCQWFHDGAPMAGETGLTLTVANFDETKAGIYSVWMSNFLSEVTCDVAELALAPPFLLHHSWTTNGLIVGFTITASNTAPFVIETAINPIGPWLPIATNPDPSLILYFTNANAFIDPQRFYRAAPWSP